MNKRICKNWNILLAVLLLMGNVASAAKQKPADGDKDNVEAKITFLTTIKKGEEKPGLPNVLLVGDSIMLEGYGPVVGKIFEGKANILWLKGGSKRSDDFLKLVKAEHLAEKKWALIHYNFGLHDCLSTKDSDKTRLTLDQYEDNLRKISEMFKTTGAKLVFCNTTPVPDENGSRTRTRTPANVAAFNELAGKIMNELKIPVNDLHAACLPHQPAIHVEPNDVHFSEDGIQYQGWIVAEFIAKELGIKIPSRPKLAFQAPAKKP